MNKRERILLSVIGSVAGLWVLYNAMSYLFLRPIRESDEKVVKLESDIHRLEGIVRSKQSLVRRWRSTVERSLSFDAAVASNRFAQDIKTLAQKYAIVIGSVAPVSGSKLGSKTGIECVAYRVMVEGRFTETLAFLVDLYRTPYPSQITRLSYSPVMQKGGPRDAVKMEFTLETPVPPRIEDKQLEELASLETMPLNGDAPITPIRVAAPSVSDFPLLADRVIFRPYVPPPTNVIVVDNQDWKTVALRIAFLWDGKLSEEVVDTLPSRTTRQYTKKGDVVEVRGAYADGKAFGPEQFDFNQKKDFTYVVAVHSPAPPPTVVDLAVDNQDKDPIDIDVAVVMKDGSSRTKPTMRIKPKTKMDIDTYECTSVQVSASYASGKRTTAATFHPKAGKQTYAVPPEPMQTPVTIAQASDPPADGTLSVTGLLTYREHQEMIASGTNVRKIIRTGDEHEVVDGGKLLAVHPVGGVVKMPSGNYYLYPLGKKYTERVKLDVVEDKDLAAAIDAWMRQ